MAVALTAAMVISTPFNVSAAKNNKKSVEAQKEAAYATYDAILCSMFDAKAYADAYADAKAKCGYDAKKLLNHYLTEGVDKGYISNLNALIDLKKYHDSYRDLQLAFGNDYKQYLIYYITFGNIDKRSSFGTFDPTAYANRYADAKRVAGTNVAALFSHYERVGKAEGRDATAVVISASSSDDSSSSSDGSCYDEKKDEDEEEHHSSSKSKSDDDDDDDNSSSCSSSGSSSSGSSSSGSSSSQTASTCGVQFERTNTSDNSTRVSGRLVNENNEPVAHAIVTVDNSSSREARGFVLCDSVNVSTPGRFRVETDEDGRYEFVFESYGNYSFSACYQDGTEVNLGTIDVVQGTETRVNDVPVFAPEEEGVTYAIEGVVKNATTGEVIPGATVKIFRGFGGTESLATVTTDEEGRYRYETSRGAYSARISIEGYVDVVQNVISANGRNSRWNDVVLTSMQSTDVVYRIVLTWGQEPSDLDSHLTGPKDNEGRFHVYFGDKIHREEEEQVVMLDVDDTSSEGPETVTIVRIPREGQYRYSVLDFSYQFINDTYLSNSGAKVKVFGGSELLREYDVPSGEGYIWNVFDIEDGEIKTINRLTGNYGSMLTGENRSFCEGDHEWNDIWTSRNDNVHARTCTNCYAQEMQEHDYDDNHECSKCGGREYVRPCDSDSHNWGSWTNADSYSHKRTCSVCSSSEYHSHTYEDGKCTECNATEPENTECSTPEPCADDAHNWQMQPTSPETHQETCTICYSHRGEEGNHTFEANEVGIMTCTVCHLDQSSNSND